MRGRVAWQQNAQRAVQRRWSNPKECFVPPPVDAKEVPTHRPFPRVRDDEDSDTQSCSDDDDSGSEADDKSCGDIDTILEKYLSIELQPKTDIEACLLTNNGAMCDTKRKRVRIALDARTGKELCRYHSDNRERRKRYCMLTWYIKADYQRFRSESHRQLGVARQSSTFVDDFSNLHAACASYPTLCNLSSEQILLISDSEHRGLENLSGLLFVERKSYLRQVLDTQQQQRSLERWSPLERAESLAVQARFLSQQSRRVAQVLGAGDALVALSWAPLPSRTNDSPCSTTDLEIDWYPSASAYNTAAFPRACEV